MAEMDEIPKGETGSACKDGTVCVNGTTGPAGLPGPQGPRGITGYPVSHHFIQYYRECLYCQRINSQGNYGIPGVDGRDGKDSNVGPEGSGGIQEQQ